MEKEKIQSLISQMTLEEKAGMCSGADFWHLKGVERLGIPSVMVTDGPHGLRKQAQGADHLGINESEKAICFPAGCATASSFDRELIRKQGELLGQECQAMDVSTILGPAMNIKRSPLCGRNFEYLSLIHIFMSAEERRIVSYHEVGHALVTALQKNTEPVQKITIVPRTMGALGYVMQTPEEEKFLNTKKELEAMIVVALGGRAAEEIVFDTVTTGASNDIEQATKIARAMITQYGMSERFGLMGLESVQSRYLDGRAVRNCGRCV